MRFKSDIGSLYGRFSTLVFRNPRRSNPGSEIGLVESNSKSRPILKGVKKQSGKGNSSRSVMSEWFTHSLALLLAGVSLASYLVAAMDGEVGLVFGAWLLSQAAFTVVASLFVRQKVRDKPDVWIIFLVLLLLAIFEIAWEFVSRTFLEQGMPFELITMGAARNLVIGLTVFAAYRQYQRYAVLLSTFLLIFTVTTYRDASILILVVSYAVGAVIWLFASHWEGVRAGMEASRRRGWPRTAVLLPIVLMSVVGMSWARAERQMSVLLGGIVPSSGGNRGQSEYSRGGIGDGEMLVAGTEQVQSFGPIEDAPFMQDDKPSLYDMFDDTYEEEVSKNLKFDRTIALPPELSRRAKKHLHSRVEKANKEFSTLRKSRKKANSKRAESITSDALFYVSGRVPLHLRLQVYDLFDGTDWYPEEEKYHSAPLRLENSQGKPWLALSDLASFRSYLAEAETHAVKIINLDSKIIPAPLYLHGVHIDRVDRADLFKYGPDGLVAMNRDSLPTLTPIHLASRTVDLEKLRARGYSPFQLPPNISEHMESAYSVIPPNVDSELLRQLVLKWSGESKKGWSQVSVIVKHLRNNYRLDPDWRPQDEQRAPVEEFLLSSNGGPDYQFATAAALLLRSVGYSSRVVSGFYADSNSYDQKSEHTPVLKKDVHFWAEVQLAGNDWVTVEATPGYEVLGPSVSISKRVWNVCLAVFAFCLEHRVLCVFCVLLSAFAVFKRRHIANICSTLVWWFEMRFVPKKSIQSTIRVLHKRALLTGNSPSNATTIYSWVGQLIQQEQHSQDFAHLSELRHLADELAYSGHCSHSTSSMEQVCRSCVQTYSLAWFNKLERGTANC